MTYRCRTVLILLGFMVSLVLGSCANRSDTAHVAAGTASVTDDSRALRPTSGVRGIFEDSTGKLYFSSPDWTCVFDPAKADEDGPCG